MNTEKTHKRKKTAFRPTSAIARAAQGDLHATQLVSTLMSFKIIFIEGNLQIVNAGERHYCALLTQSVRVQLICLVQLTH